MLLVISWDQRQECVCAEFSHDPHPISHLPLEFQVLWFRAHVHLQGCYHQAGSFVATGWQELRLCSHLKLLCRGQWAPSKVDRGQPERNLDPDRHIRLREPVDGSQRWLFGKKTPRVPPVTITNAWWRWWLMPTQYLHCWCGCRWRIYKSWQTQKRN